MEGLALTRAGPHAPQRTARTVLVVDFALAFAAVLWAPVAVAATLGLAAVPQPTLVVVGFPLALLAAVVFRRSGTTPVLAWATGLSAALAFALLVLPSLTESVMYSLGIPALLITAAICRSRPLIGLFVLFFLTGAFGSLTALTPVTPGPIVQLLLLALWGACLWSYAVGSERPRLRAMPELWLPLAYIAFTALSVGLSDDQLFALEAFRGSTWFMLAGVLIAIAPWPASVYHAASRAFVLVAAMVGAYATVRWIIGPAAAEEKAALALAGPYNVVDGEVRLFGSFNSGHQLGTWTGLALPFCTAALVTLRGRWRLVALAACALCAVALLGSEVRGSFVAALAGLSLVVLLYQLSRGFPGLHIGATAVVLTTGVLVGTVVFSFTAGRSEGSTARYENILSPSKDASYQERVIKWKDALQESQGQLFGEGLGRGGLTQTVNGRFRTAGSVNVDNGYVKVLYEQGLVMLVLFVVGALGLLAALAIRGARSTDRETAGLAIGACGASTSFLVSLISGVYIEELLGLTAWLLIGLGVGALSIARRAPVTSASPRVVAQAAPAPARAPLELPAVPVPPVVVPETRPLRVLFVCTSDFRSPTEKQILGFAQGLSERGQPVMISFGGDPASVAEEGADQVPGLRLHNHGFAIGGPREQDLEAARAFRPDLVHAVNPRVPTLTVTRAYSSATGAPVFVHFEDDEWGLKESEPTGLRERLAKVGRLLGSRLHPPAWTYATDATLRYVAEEALALDALTPALAREVEARLGRECAVILPTLADLGEGPEHDAPALDLPDDRSLVAYTGVVDTMHAEDVLIGMTAVAELQQRGHEVTFVHAGRTVPRVDLRALGVRAGLAPGSLLQLGYLSPEELRELLRRATVLLQPGRATEFNRLRLPSKLQAYLESGTPTVTYAVGPGELLEDGVEVLKTNTGNPSELADRIGELLDDQSLRERLGQGGSAAAARLFDRAANSEALLSHYRVALGAGMASPIERRSALHR